MTDNKDKQTGTSVADSTAAANTAKNATDISADPILPETTSSAKKPTNPNSSGVLARVPWIASLAIILVVMVGMISLQNGQQASQLQNMQQKAADLDQQLLKEQQKFDQQLASIQSSLQSNLSQNSSQFEKLQSDLATAQQDRFDLEEKIKQVSLQASAKGRDPVKWRIAEIEYLLSLANHRLVLSQDHNTALTALNDADKRLRTIADPGLSQIRMSIASEIKELQSVQVPDIAGMAMKLSALVDGIAQLPLVNTERKLARQESGIGEEVDNWDQIPAAIWRDIKGLVTVRRSELSIEPILPPDELHYLSQNLGLKIEQARLALLRKDTTLFRSNLKDTGLWVSRYFDSDTAAVTHVMDTINSLLTAEVVTTMPDISGSLRQLRRWRDIQETALYITPTSIKTAPIKSGSIKPSLTNPAPKASKTITQKSVEPKKAVAKIAVLPETITEKTPPASVPRVSDKKTEDVVKIKNNGDRANESNETASLSSTKSKPEKEVKEVVLIPKQAVGADNIESAEIDRDTLAPSNSDITPALELGLTTQSEQTKPTDDPGISSETTSDSSAAVDAVSSHKEVTP